MDKLSNMLITIKNGGIAGKQTVAVPYSGYKATIARALFQEGYIKAYTQKKAEKRDLLEIDLLYTKQSKPRISYLKRISKPSKRVYSNVKNLYSVKQGHGRLFLSTPKGILTEEQAKKELVGGELLFEIA